MNIFWILGALASIPLAHSAEDGCGLAIVESTAGNSILITAAGGKAPLSDQDTLAQGDQLVTGRDAWVDLRLCDGSGVRVGENSKFSLEEAETSAESWVSFAFRLARGSMFATVNSAESGDRVKFRVRTPTAAMGVRGTEFLVDASEGPQAETQLHTLSGEVLMGPPGDFKKLSELRGAALTAQFEPVGREQASRMAQGEAHPSKARPFPIAELRGQRKGYFQKPIQRVNREALQSRFRGAGERRRNAQAERPLFQRPREQLNRRVEQTLPQAGGKAGRRKRRKATRERAAP